MTLHYYRCPEHGLEPTRIMGRGDAAFCAQRWQGPPSGEVKPL